MTLRRWKFHIDTDDGCGYLLTSGELIHDTSTPEDWIGTSAEADKEACRRADLYEELTGTTCNRIVFESQGKV